MPNALGFTEEQQTPTQTTPEQDMELDPMVKQVDNGASHDEEEVDDVLEESRAGPSSQGGEEEFTSSPPIPTAGPAYWEYRRAQWLSGSGEFSTTMPFAPPPVETLVQPGSSRAKLESILAVPGAEENEDLWRNYLGNIHKNLVEGTRLRKPLKLSIVVSRVSLYLSDAVENGYMAPNSECTPLCTLICAFRLILHLFDLVLTCS
jgi:hypothetical protein